MKAKTDLTAELVLDAVNGGATSLTAISKGLGFKGSVSGSTAKAIRGLVPDVEDRLAANKANKANKGGADEGDTKDKPAKVAKTSKVKTAKAKGKAMSVKVAKTKPAKAPIQEGKWPRDKRNVFRAGSSYGIAFDILAAHKSGIEKEKWLDLLAEATGKDVKHSGYDAQVLLSAKPNENGLSNNDSPRHRSCRPGFWIQRTNGHVKLIVD